MDLLLKTFSLSQEDFDIHNKKTTEHVQHYKDGSMDEMFTHLYTYLDGLDNSLSEYCELGADKCRLNNFRDFCEKLDIDIAENQARIITEYYHIFENKHEILEYPKVFYSRLDRMNRYHFYSRDRKFMFTCTSPLYMSGSMAYFGCTGEREKVIKALEMIYEDGNRDLCYGGRDYA